MKTPFCSSCGQSMAKAKFIGIIKTASLYNCPNPKCDTTLGVIADFTRLDDVLIRDGDTFRVRAKVRLTLIDE